VLVDFYSLLLFVNFSSVRLFLAALRLARAVYGIILRGVVLFVVVLLLLVDDYSPLTLENDGSGPT